MSELELLESFIESFIIKSQVRETDIRWVFDDNLGIIFHISP